MTPDAMKEARNIITDLDIMALQSKARDWRNMIATALAKRDEEIGRMKKALEDIKYHADNPFASKNGEENRKWLAYCQDVAIQALERE